MSITALTIPMMGVGTSNFQNGQRSKDSLRQTISFSYLAGSDGDWGGLLNNGPLCLRTYRAYSALGMHDLEDFTSTITPIEECCGSHGRRGLEITH